MKTSIARAAFFSIACLLCTAEARAADIDGAWVSNASVCDQVFEKRGDTISISNTSEAHGSGFIIDGNRLRGKLVDCEIKTRRQEGPVVHLIAACATDVALSYVQFSLRKDGEDRITRVFPGIPELQLSYVRCRL
jgi:hypothetical protein